MPAPIEILSIGDGIERNASFNRIADAAVSRSAIYVLDAADRVVKQFDFSGRFLRRFGREGNGPGEFMNAGSIRIVDSIVEVRDGRNRRVIGFSVDGRHVGTRTVESDDWRVRRWAVRGGASLTEVGPELRSFGIATPPARIANRAVGLEQVKTGGSGPRSFDTMFTIRPDTAFYRREGSRGGWTPIGTAFGASGAWAISGDSLVAHADGYAGVVTWYRIDADGFHTVRTAALGRGQGRAITPDVKAAEETRLNRSATPVGKSKPGRPVSTPGPIRLAGLPPQWSVATRAIFATDGSLWISDQTWITVESAKAGDSTSWTVFSAAGERTTIELPKSFTVVAINDGRIFGYDTKIKDVHVVLVYSFK